MSSKFNAINLRQTDTFTLIRLWGLKLEMLLVKTEKCILKFRSNLKWLWIVKTISKKNKVGGLILSNFKTYSTANKTVWCWNEDRPADQQNKTESPEINPHIYSQNIFDKDLTVNEERTVFQQMVLVKLENHKPFYIKIKLKAKTVRLKN